jgi:hypothetical protein
MDADRFDAAARSLVRAAGRRRFLLGAVAAGLGLAGAETAPAKRRKTCRKSCGACRRCRNGRCKARGDGTACGGGRVCTGGACRCPDGQKACQGGCIAETECCDGCADDLTCCTNVGACKDLRNDFAFCGGCTNAACANGALCMNGECGLTCELGQPCFTGCTCATRADDAHPSQTVCASATCATATTCDSDGDCGFARVCVEGLCPPFNVCAAPCA